MMMMMMMTTMRRRRRRRRRMAMNVMEMMMITMVESWFTNLEKMPLNHSQQLPVPYKRLIDQIKQN